MANRTFNRLEVAFVEATCEIRSALADTNLTHVSFRIEAEGRVDGDLKIFLSARAALVERRVGRRRSPRPGPQRVPSPERWEEGQSAPDAHAAGQRCA